MAKNIDTLARQLAAKKDISIVKATAEIREVLELIKSNIDTKNSVKLANFGKFTVRDRSGVLQGKPYSTKVITFTSAKAFKNRANAKVK